MKLPVFLLNTIALVTASAANDPAILTQEFIYEDAPFPSCHASTIVETADGLVAAWFGGTAEGKPDVEIWTSRHRDGKWSTPVSVANGVQPDGTRHPCWNPVLFQPDHGPLMLFYKVGPSPQKWWGLVRTSSDQGATWGEPTLLPSGVLGPIRNKPIQLADGTILSPSSYEDPATDAWTIHFERSTDGGKTWTLHRPPPHPKISAIQPSILRLGGDRLLAVGRTRENRIFECRSTDAGRTWGDVQLGTLPNPNSGIDAVTLRDGRHLIVYNHVPGTPGQWGGRRSPLNVAVSNDGHEWQAALVLENEKGREFSYPAVIQTRDGLVHITYTWQRKRVCHVVIDPEKLVLRSMPNGQWP